MIWFASFSSFRGLFFIVGMTSSTTRHEHYSQSPLTGSTSSKRIWDVHAQPLCVAQGSPACYVTIISIITMEHVMPLVFYWNWEGNGTARVNPASVKRL